MFVTLRYMLHSSNPHLSLCFLVAETPPPHFSIFTGQVLLAAVSLVLQPPRGSLCDPHAFAKSVLTLLLLRQPCFPKAATPELFIAANVASATVSSLDLPSQLHREHHQVLGISFCHFPAFACCRSSSRSLSMPPTRAILYFALNSLYHVNLHLITTSTAS